VVLILSSFMPAAGPFILQLWTTLSLYDLSVQIWACALVSCLLCSVDLSLMDVFFYFNCLSNTTSLGCNNSCQLIAYLLLSRWRTHYWFSNIIWQLRLIHGCIALQFAFVWVRNTILHTRPALYYSTNPSFSFGHCFSGSLGAELRCALIRRRRCGEQRGEWRRRLDWELERRG
jgi:hypothetical protein